MKANQAEKDFRDMSGALKASGYREKLVTVKPARAMLGGLLCALPFAAVFGAVYRLLLTDRAHLSDVGGIGFYAMFIGLGACGRPGLGRGAVQLQRPDAELRVHRPARARAVHSRCAGALCAARRRERGFHVRLPWHGVRAHHACQFPPRRGGPADSLQRDARARRADR